MATVVDAAAASGGAAGQPASPRLRILFLIDEIDSLDAGGTERQILQKIHLSQRLGYDPTLVVLRGTEWLDATIAGCPVFSAHAWSLFRPSGWRGCWSLVRWMRQQKIALVQTFFVESNIVGPWLARMAGVPVVIGTRRNLDQGERRVGWRRPAIHFLERMAGRSMDCMAVNSDRVSDKVVATRIIPLRKVRVEYNGIDLASFSDLDLRRDHTRRALGVGENELLIGNVSGLRPVKGLLPFVEAARIALAEDRTLRFLLIGDGEHRPAIEERIRSYGLTDRVHLAGAQVEVLPYLAAMDVGVLSSLAEGFSNSLLEYMAAGLPAVATDVGGNREALADAGILVPPDDPPALAEAFLSLRSPELRQCLGQAARRRIERFSLERAEQRMEEIYDECLRAKGMRDSTRLPLEFEGKRA